MRRFNFRFGTLALFLSLSVLLDSCHKDDSGSVPDNIPETKPTGTFPEDFEYNSKTSYLPSSADLSSGSWYFDDAVTGNSLADEKDGKQSARIRNTGKLIMLFDKADGADTVIIKHAAYGTDGASSWELWMSSNGGNSWSKVGNTVNSTSGPLTSQAFIVKQTGKVRFEIVKVSGGSNQINIDDISIGNYTVSNPIPNPTTGDNDNMLLGNPSNATSDLLNANNYLMIKPQYTLSYSNTKHTPNWTSWHVTSTDLGSTGRQDNFRQDTTLPTGWYQVVSSEFSGSGFDRGHMCPSADRTSSVAENSATFLMTNMIPQAPKNNQVTWANLENYSRALVNQGNEVYIICGPYGQGGTGSNGYATTVGNGVVVPAQTWKIIVVLPNGNSDLSRITTSTRVIAVLMPNNQTVSDQPWGYYRVSVDQIEALTGYDFMSNVPTSIQSILEAKVDDGPTQ